VRRWDHHISSPLPVGTACNGPTSPFLQFPLATLPIVTPAPGEHV